MLLDIDCEGDKVNDGVDVTLGVCVCVRLEDTDCVFVVLDVGVTEGEIEVVADREEVTDCDRVTDGE